MRRPLLLFLFLLLCFGCDSQEKKRANEEFRTESNDLPVEIQADVEFTAESHDSPRGKEESDDFPGKKYTYEEFRAEFSDSFSIYEIPIGTYFWDEFGELEAQYGLSADESKLLGMWMNATFPRSSYYNYYIFFPNKLFLITFKPGNFQVISTEKIYFDKAVGTWEIAGGSVRITIYAIVTEDYALEFPGNKGLFFLERPYSFDFINIDDIDERGFTARPINNAIMLSEELQRKASIKEPNRTNNLYVRNVYTIDVITSSGKPEKNYNYFSIVPELARDNVSGLDVATNFELIRKYIPDWWF